MCLYKNTFNALFKVHFPITASRNSYNVPVEINRTRHLKEICDKKPMWEKYYFYMHIFKVIINLVGAKTCIFP